MLLPRNITVEALSENVSIIRILDPKIMVSVGNLSENEALVEVTNETYEKLSHVANLLKKLE